jgi:two-component system sensor histidine kinase CpxA
MKVSSPLSLKVSVWLVLNLLLLAGLGMGFFILQGGLGWSSLVAGPTGDRAQALFNIIAGEAAAATGDARQAVLQRFGKAYGADFQLFSFGENLVAGQARELPASVRERLEFRGFSRGFSGRSRGSRDFTPPGESPRGSESDADRPRPWDRAEKTPRPASDRPPAPGDPRPPSEKLRPEPDTFRRGEPGPLPPPPDLRFGRFVIRDGSPAAYWVGMRVPFAPAERNNRLLPATLVARVDSIHSVLHLLGLQTWLFAGSAVLALSVLFWLPLVRSITRSLRQLTAATEQIAEGRFDTRVDASRRDELGLLGDSVNRMATRLDAHMTGQKRFLGDVAHELCSPLARLQMATGILADQAPPALRENVADVREEVQQISALVNELLAFTKAGLQPREVALAPLELEPIARSVLEREGATDRAQLSLPAGLRVLADPDLLGRALGNLVRNAVRYAGDAGPFTVTATAANDQVVIAIEDQGPGVPAADLDRLGEPFFRPELARTRETGGVGLGLAIVRSSIAACRGEVRFSNRAPHGLRVELRLPAA